MSDEYEITLRVTTHPPEGFANFQTYFEVDAGDGGPGFNVDSVTTKLAEDGYAAQRNLLVNWCQEKAAPIQYTATGTVYSAMHNLGEYLSRLETLADETRELVGDHCSSHFDPQETCSTCVVIELLKKVNR